MSVLNRIKSLFTFAGPAEGGKDEFSAAIIDIESLTITGANGRQPSAQEKVSTLNRLALFLEREKLSLTAVLNGPALRVATDGGNFRGVRVRYVDRNDDAARFIVGLLQQSQRGGTSVVVTADRQVERAVLAIQGKVMHPSTFRKALEPVEIPRPKQNVRSVPVVKQVDENKRIVNELIDPL
ncbi:MAG: hypothetical protein WCN95_00320 [bacterium]